MQIQQPPPTGNPALDTWLQRLAMQISDEIDDNIKLADGKEIYADVIRARNGDGLWLQDDEDNGIQITDGGIWHGAKQSGCGVRLTSNQTITTGTWTKLQFGTEWWDIQNEFDNATNYRFTASKAGKYIACTSGQLGSLGDGKKLRVIFYKNGAAHTAYSQIPGGAASTMDAQIAGIFDLAANDYIEVFIAHDHGSDRTAEAGDYRNTLQIAKIA